MLRGSALTEPSPEKSACRNATLTAGGGGPDELRAPSCRRCAAPPSRPGVTARSAVTLWTSSSWSSEPEAMSRRERYRRPPTTRSYASRTSWKKSSSMLLKPARDDGEEAFAHPCVRRGALRPTGSAWPFRTRRDAAATCTTRSPGRISSSRLQSSVGTPATDRIVSTGWLCVPVSSKPSRVRSRSVGCSPEWKTLLADTGLPRAVLDLEVDVRVAVRNCAGREVGDASRRPVGHPDQGIAGDDSTSSRQLGHFRGNRSSPDPAPADISTPRAGRAARGCRKWHCRRAGGNCPSHRRRRGRTC